MSKKIIRWRQGWLLVAFAGTIATCAAETPIQFLGPNIVPNPGFETAGEAKSYAPWTVTGLSKGAEANIDTSVALEGKCSMRLAALESGAQLVLQSPSIPVKGGQIYLFSIAFRQEGFTIHQKGPPYCGVSSFPQVCWLDAQSRVIGSGSIGQFPYSSWPWDMRDAFETAPAMARFVQIKVSISNDSEKHSGKTIPSTLWVDAIQLRAYSPPPTPAWALGKAELIVDGDASSSPVLTWFANDTQIWHSLGGKWSRSVRDDQAEHGTALEAPPDVGPGMMGHGRYNPSLPAGPGVYRLQVRAKLPPNGGNAGSVDVTSQRCGTRLKLDISGNDRNSGYRTWEGDFILRDSGWWCVRMHTLGKSSWRIDSVKIIPVFPFSDRQLMSIYPATVEELPADLLPASYQPVFGGPLQPSRTWLVGGLGSDWFQLTRTFKLLHRDNETEVTWVDKKSPTAVINGLPEDMSTLLFRNNLICLCNVPMNVMPLTLKSAIREYVRRGGGLLVLGGHQGYERGCWQGSFLEEIMPVEVAATAPDGLIDLGSGLQISPGTIPPDCLAAIPLKDLPYVRYLHKVKLKPGAQVLMKAGEYPFIVGWHSGKGRVVCVLGRAEGTMPKEHLPFWQWQYWPLLLRDAGWWAVGYSEIGK